MSPPNSHAGSRMTSPPTCGAGSRSPPFSAARPSPTCCARCSNVNFPTVKESQDDRCSRHVTGQRCAARASVRRHDPCRADVDREEDRVLDQRSEEHTSELQSLMRISYDVFCLKKKNKKNNKTIEIMKLRTPIIYVTINLTVEVSLNLHTLTHVLRNTHTH